MNNIFDWQNNQEKSQISLQNNYNKQDNIDVCNAKENIFNEQKKSFDLNQIELVNDEKNQFLFKQIQQQSNHEEIQEDLEKNEEENMEFDQSIEQKLNEIWIECYIDLNEQQNEIVKHELWEEKEQKNQIIQKEYLNWEINHQQSKQYHNEQDFKKSYKECVTEEAQQIEAQDNINDSFQQEYVNLEIYNNQQNQKIENSLNLQQVCANNMLQVSASSDEFKQIHQPIIPEQNKNNSQSNEQQQYSTAQLATYYSDDPPVIKLNFPPQISEDAIIYALNILNEFNKNNLTFYLADDNNFYMRNSTNTLSYDQIISVKRQIEDFLVQISMKTNYDTIYYDVIKFIQQQNI